MADALDKHQWIIDSVRTDFGAEIVPLMDSEENIIDSTISTCLVEYWIMFPHVYKDTFNVQYIGTYQRRVEDIRSAAFDSSSAAFRNSYYIGIIRTSEVNRMVQYSNIDSYLLQTPYGSPVRMAGNAAAPLNWDRIMLEQTENDLISGEVEISFDRMTQTIEFLVPTFFGQVTAWHGFGFVDPELTMIPISHLPIFKRMFSIRFIDAVIAARTQITLNADFVINVEALKAKRDEYKQEFEKDRYNSVPVVLTW